MKPLHIYIWCSTKTIHIHMLVNSHSYIDKIKNKHIYIYNECVLFSYCTIGCTKLRNEIETQRTKRNILKYATKRNILKCETKRNKLKCETQRNTEPVSLTFHSASSTFHRCFLPSFGSFAQAVSEEKIS
jgi:hypothetical protein